MKTAVASEDNPYAPRVCWYIEMWDVKSLRWISSAPGYDWDKVIGMLHGMQMENPTKVYRVIREDAQYTVAVPPTGAVPGAAGEGEFGGAGDMP